VSQYQKGKTNLDFTEARDSEWQWHQLGHMQVCILLQTDKHASTPPLIGCIYITKMLSFSEEPQLHSSPICLKSENKHHWVTGNASGL